MTVSLENIASLKDNSLYYLSDKGEVKKAGLWTKFKYVANLGHSRERVNNLLNEVKNILLQQSEGKGAGKIEARLRETDISSGIKGSAIKQLVNNFRVAQKDQILRVAAKNTANEMVSKIINVAGKGRIVESDELKDLYMHVASQFTSKPPVREYNGDVQVDQEALKNSLRTVLDALTNELVSISNSEALESPKITPMYAKYLKSALYDGKGVRNDKTIADLKVPKEVYLEQITRAIKPKDEEKVLFKETSSYLISLLDKDNDLDKLLMNGFMRILKGGDNKLRSLNSVKAKIEGIQSNLNEVNKLKKSSPKLYKQIIENIKGLNGQAFPENCISKCIELSKEISLTPILKVNSDSSQLELYNAVSCFSNAMEDIYSQSGLGALGTGGDELAVSKDLIATCILSRLSSEQRANLFGAISSSNYAKLHSFCSKTCLDYAFFKGAKDEAKTGASIMTENMKVFPLIKGIVQRQMGMTPDPEIPFYDGEVSFNSEYRSIIDNVHKQSVDFIKKDLSSFVDNRIKGNASDSIKKEFIKRMEQQRNQNELAANNVFKAKTNFEEIISQEVKSSLTDSIFSSIKTNSLFKQKLSQGLSVTLPGGKKLSSDYDTAMDELSQLVMKNDTASFDALSEKDKKKVLIVSSMLSLENGKSIADMFISSFNEGHKHPLFSYTGIDEEPNLNNEYSIRINELGKIEISVNSHIELSSFSLRKNRIEASPDSFLKNTLTIALDYDSLDQLSDFDFSNADDEDFLFKPEITADVELRLNRSR